MILLKGIYLILLNQIAKTNTHVNNSILKKKILGGDIAPRPTIAPSLDRELYTCGQQQFGLLATILFQKMHGARTTTLFPERNTANWNMDLRKLKETAVFPTHRL